MGYKRDRICQNGRKYGYKRDKMSLEEAGLPPLAELLIKGEVRLDGADVAGVWERLKNATLVDCTSFVKSDSWPSKEEVQKRWGSTEETLVLGCDKLEDFILPREQTWFEYFGPVSGNLTAMTLAKTSGDDSYDVNLLELREDGSLFTPEGKSHLAFELFDDDQSGCVGEWFQAPNPSTLQYNLSPDGHLAALVYCLRSINSSHSYRAEPSRAQRRAVESLTKKAGIPLTSYSTIRLREGVPSPTLTTTLITMQDKRKQSLEHWVRGHPQMRNGKKIMVKPYKRGNPRLGTIKSSYVVEGDPPKK